MKVIREAIVAVAVGVTILFAPFTVYAALSVSVTPYEGGVDLRFGNVNSADVMPIDRQVNVRITATDNTQYMLYQQLLDSLTNERGERLPVQSFVGNALSGRNQYGTVHLSQERPVSTSRALIYTSNTAGLSDSLILSYGIRLSPQVSPGRYTGRIAYTLVPVRGTQAPRPEILNISVQIESKTIVSITTVKGSRSISLSTAKEQPLPEQVSIEIKNNIGRQYKIYQLLGSTFVSAKGQPLPVGAIRYAVSGGDKGSRNTAEQVLSQNKQLLYSSSQKGEQDSFVVNYLIGDVKDAKAGTYRGTLQYLLEIAAGETKIIDTFTIELINEEVFSLSVDLDRGGRIAFDNLKPLDKPKQSEVLVEVTSNLGEPYQVIQTVYSELVNKAGEKIPGKYFTVRTEAVDDEPLAGLKFTQASEVKSKDTVLYVSDKKGSSATFKVVYELSVPDTVKADDYGSNIVFSLMKIQ
ncbi:MAG: hypothetical protein KBA46_06045 [Candidatus Omnitrophica bacterium]|nr:hypothetical protein [Candidatus Omnitrophota bacterium]